MGVVGRWKIKDGHPLSLLFITLSWMSIRICLIKTLLWKKISVKEKEYNIRYICLLKTLPGKSSGTKPW